MLDFRHRNDREIFGEQEVTGEEQPEGSQVKSDFIDGGCIISTPAAWHIIPENGSSNNYESFVPHADIYNHRHKESHRNVPPQFSEPKYLRRNHIATHHQIVTPSIGRKWICARLKESIAFKFVLAIPGHKQFREISATYNRACEHNDFIHYIDMLDSNIVFQLQYFTCDDQQGLYHGKS